MISTEKGHRIPLAMGDPALYLLVGETGPCHQRRGPWWVKDGVTATKIHIISPAAGGEVHGYWLIDGTPWIDTTGMHVPWPEVDAEFARVTGLMPRFRVQS